MRIKNIISRNRRDFRAIYVCEHCDHEEVRPGYDDANFHNNVVPKMTCSECGKGKHDSYSPMEPRYPEGMSV